MTLRLLAASAGCVALGVACTRSTTTIVESPPDVAAVGGSVSAPSGGGVAGATLSIEAFRETGTGAQFLGAFPAQTDSGGRFVRALVLGPLGLQECRLRLTVTPPAGSGLATQVDSVVARVNAGWPPADTAMVSVVLAP